MRTRKILTAAAARTKLPSVHTEALPEPASSDFGYETVWKRIRPFMIRASGYDMEGWESDTDDFYWDFGNWGWAPLLSLSGRKTWPPAGLTAYCFTGTADSASEEHFSQGPQNAYGLPPGAVHPLYSIIRSVNSS